MFVCLIFTGIQIALLSSSNNSSCDAKLLTSATTRRGEEKKKNFSKTAPKLFVPPLLVCRSLYNDLLWRKTVVTFSWNFTCLHKSVKV